MSVFRNSRPNEREADANQPADLAPSRPESNGDLLQRPEAAEQPRASFPSFVEREARAESKSTPTPLDKCTNIIAVGSRWNGSFSVEDSVRIDGQLSGEVIAKHTVHIAEGAQVEAKIRAAFVVVSGTFKGEVTCDERLELLPKSRVQGTFVTKGLSVEEGAVIDGSIQMSSDATAPTQRSREAVKT